MGSDEESVSRAVRASFPERSVTAIELQSTRPGNETGLVTFADGEQVYVKTATDTTRRLVRETAATRYASRHAACGVPSVLAAQPTSDPPVLATRPIDGTAFRDRWTPATDRRRTVASKAGKTIAGLHAATAPTPGVVRGWTDAAAASTPLDLRATTWSECATIEWRVNDWFPSRFTDCADRLIETIRAVEPTCSTPRLLHGDCTRSNVYLDPPGLIDLERAMVGDPGLDVVCALEHLLRQPDVAADDRPQLCAAFRDG